jgi:hypothetical protein
MIEEQSDRTFSFLGVGRVGIAHLTTTTLILVFKLVKGAIEMFYFII